jgi:hypothetical protein
VEQILVLQFVGKLLALLSKIPEKTGQENTVAYSDKGSIKKKQLVFYVLDAQAK